MRARALLCAHVLPHGWLVVCSIRTALHSLGAWRKHCRTLITLHYLTLVFVLTLRAQMLLGDAKKTLEALRAKVAEMNPN